VGVGTVITAEDVSRSVEAGAKFLVSPGSTPALIDAALESGIPILPGVNSPSEAMALLARGISYMKFFPAQAAGGIPMLKSIAGPLPQIKFCPTGGINEANAADFLALDNVLCVGGTWMLNKEALAAKDWPSIERMAKSAASI
jgi:2-dehydro-3-deoxyphosphogluconate aldolase/(4S)-4-hydroxy-2-oxoglutarate aldolase